MNKKRKTNLNEEEETELDVTNLSGRVYTFMRNYT